MPFCWFWELGMEPQKVGLEAEHVTRSAFRAVDDVPRAMFQYYDGLRTTPSMPSRSRPSRRNSL